MDILELSKLSTLKINKYEYKHKHTCDFSQTPRPHSCLALLLEGSAVFTIDNNQISVGKGELIYVPITSTYISQWSGTPDVSYISLHFAFDSPKMFYEQSNYFLQKVLVKDFADMKAKFQYILEHLNGEYSQQISSLGKFYNIISDVFPHLKKKEHKPLDESMQKVIEYIQMHCGEQIRVSNLCQICNMSISHFHMCFKKSTGMSAIKYKNMVSIKKAIPLLINEKEKSIDEISLELGFSSPEYFRRTFKNFMGKSPREYRKTVSEMIGI